MAALAVAIVVPGALPACRSDGPDPVARARECLTPGPRAAGPYLPAPRSELEPCFKKVMGDVAARHFLLGAGNAALSDWFIRYTAEISQRLANDGQYPDAEVASIQTLKDGAAQINELYRALAAALTTRLSTKQIAWTLRSALELTAAQTGVALTEHKPLDLVAAGAAYVTGDLASRIAGNYKFLEGKVKTASEVRVSYELTKSDLRDGISVALWADDRIRTYLMTPGHFSDDRGGSLVAYPPPRERFSGGPIEPPLEGPGHVLNYPDLGNPDRTDIRAVWNGGPLEIVADKGINLLGFDGTLDDIKKMAENRK